MKRTQTLVVALTSILLLLAQGCDSGSESKLTVVESCNEVLETMCARLFDCFTASQLGFASEAECSDGASESLCPDIKSARDRGTLVFNQSNHSPCVASMRGLACTDDVAAFSDRIGSEQVCTDLFQGTQTKGEACSTTSECAGADSQCRADGRCTGNLSGAAFEQECNELTAGACEGLSCLTLKSNLQQKDGICTAACESNSDCGAGAVCVDFTSLGRAICLSECAKDSDCGGGFRVRRDAAQERGWGLLGRDLNRGRGPVGPLGRPAKGM
ncbi:MAG: hypothetical protein R3F39_25345 [Myxococcota bacterium]